MKSARYLATLDALRHLEDGAFRTQEVQPVAMYPHLCCELVGELIVEPK